MFTNKITPEELENMNLFSFPGKIYIIDKINKDFDEAIRYLKQKTIIGFDTESKPLFTPGQHRNKVALLQLSGAEKAFLFRLNKIGLPKKLFNILSSSKILKIGAAVLDDVRGLQKYNKFKSEGFVDLQKIVEEYGIADKSVKKMAGIILGVRISKSQQLSNWEAEELSEAQQAYAATDAWICREMYKKLLKSKKINISSKEIKVENGKNNIKKR